MAADPSAVSATLPVLYVCRLPERTLCPTAQVIGKDVKQYQPQCQSLWLITCDWPPDGLKAADGSPVSSTFEQFPVHMRVQLPNLDYIHLFA